MTTPVRIWDLPTRLFHWLLAAAVVALVITGKLGGNAMLWHFRLGYAVLALLVFRLLWGLVGGHWSRFASFFPTPGRLTRYLRQRATAEDKAGHNPLGSLSVLGMMAVLLMQTLTGMMTDDEIAYAGPLTARAPGEWIGFSTTWHSNWGQYLVLGLVALHIAAIVVYRLMGHNLLKPMIVGDKDMDAPVPASRDNAHTRLLALALMAAAAAAVWALLAWATPASLV